MKKLITIISFILSLTSIYAATNTAASPPTLATVQAAVNASSSGDTVLIPDGTMIWNGGLNLGGKQIFIRAQNYTATPAGMKGAGTSSRNVVIQNNSGSTLFPFTTGNGAHCGIAGIRLNEGSGSGGMVSFSGTGSKIGIIADCYIQAKIRSYPSSRLLSFTSLGGLIYNTVIEGTGNVEQVGEGSCLILQQDVRAWTTPSTMGVLDVNGNVNVYMEDSTFKNIGNFPDGDSGARFVVRHCIYDGSWGETHGYTSGGIGGRHAEYYNNNFKVTTANRNMSGRYFWLRQGTIVFTENDCRTDNTGYNNHVQLQIGDTQGAGSYPTPKQPGWGHNGTANVSDPIYIWNQTGTAAYTWNFQGSAWQSLVQQGRDIFVNQGAKPGYTKYTYPHPVRNVSTPNPLSPPVNVRIVSN